MYNNTQIANIFCLFVGYATEKFARRNSWQEAAAFDHWIFFSVAFLLDFCGIVKYLHNKPYGLVNNKNT